MNANTDVLRIPTQGKRDWTPADLMRIQRNSFSMGS